MIFKTALSAAIEINNSEIVKLLLTNKNLNINILNIFNIFIYKI